MSPTSIDLDSFNLLPWRSRLDRRASVLFGWVCLSTLALTLLIQMLWFVFSVGDEATWSSSDWSDQQAQREAMYRSLHRQWEDQAPRSHQYQQETEALALGLDRLARWEARSAGPMDVLSRWLALRPKGVWIETLEWVQTISASEGMDQAEVSVIIQGIAVSDALLDGFLEAMTEAEAHDVTVMPADPDGFYSFSMSMEVLP